MAPSPTRTADLLDDTPSLPTAEPIFRDFGGRVCFEGPIRTCRAPRDNGTVAELLGTPGVGAVLVVDGGGALDCALLGDRLGALAVEHGWAGIVVNGCVRDTAELAQMPLGVRALAAMPRKSIKRGAGEKDLVLEFAGVRFEPGHVLVADEDGIVICPPLPEL